MPKLITDTAAGSVRGKKREANEDSAFCITGIAPVSGPTVQTLAVVAVTGGMGGAGLGDAASNAIQDFIESIFGEGKEIQFGHQHGISSGDYPALLNEVFFEGHRRIYESAAQAHQSGIMGTTLALGVIGYHAADDKTYLHVGNVGNNRGYIIRGEQIFHATEEDSVAWRLYKKGEITYSELLAHPLRSQITVMGINSAISPEVHSIELHANDCVLFCTDGVHEHLDDAAIQHVIHTSKNAARACERLLASALSASGKKGNAAAAIAFLSAAPVGEAFAHAGSIHAAAAQKSAVLTTPGQKQQRPRASTKRTLIVVWTVVAVLAAGALAVYFLLPVHDVVPGRVGSRADSTVAQQQILRKESLATVPPSTSEETRIETPRDKYAEGQSSTGKQQRPVTAGATNMQSRSAAAEGAPIGVEWNPETERFRIRTKGGNVVPLTLSYGDERFDVVPVKGLPNLYRTTTSLDAGSLSVSRRVLVKVSNSKLPIAVTFTITK
ncbi:MAG TPA: hypothetical protein VK470_01965 [Bacteroidota bacterium]|nr:hypothetical protein [Bacteroidota bacterium]